MPFDKTELMRRWSALLPRERVLLVVGLAAVLLAAVYGFIYQPMQAENHRLQQQLQVQQQTYGHLQEVAKRVAQLRQSGAQESVTPMEPAAVVADSSKQMGLDGYIKQQQVNKEGELELDLQQMPFDKLVYWLGALQQQNGIVVKKADVRRDDAKAVWLDGKLILANTFSTAN